MWEALPRTIRVHFFQDEEDPVTMTHARHTEDGDIYREEEGRREFTVTRDVSPLQVPSEHTAYFFMIIAFPFPKYTCIGIQKSEDWGDVYLRPLCTAAGTAWKPCAHRHSSDTKRDIPFTKLYQTPCCDVTHENNQGEDSSAWFVCHGGKSGFCSRPDGSGSSTYNARK